MEKRIHRIRMGKNGHIESVPVHLKSHQEAEQFIRGYKGVYKTGELIWKNYIRKNALIFHEDELFEEYFDDFLEDLLDKDLDDDMKLYIQYLLTKDMNFIKDIDMNILKYFEQIIHDQFEKYLKLNYD